LKNSESMGLGVVKGRSPLCWPKASGSNLTAFNKTNGRTGKKNGLPCP